MGGGRGSAICPFPYIGSKSIVGMTQILKAASIIGAVATMISESMGDALGGQGLIFMLSSRPEVEAPTPVFSIRVPNNLIRSSVVMWIFTKL